MRTGSCLTHLLGEQVHILFVATLRSVVQLYQSQGLRDRQADRQESDSETDTQTGDRQTDRSQTVRQTVRQRDRETDSQSQTETDRQTDRQLDSHTDRDGQKDKPGDVGPRETEASLWRPHRYSRFVFSNGYQPGLGSAAIDFQSMGAA